MEKKWAKGDTQRYQELNKEFENLGAKNTYCLKCDDENFIYYINAKNELARTRIEGDTSTLIMWVGEEIKLQETKQPKYTFGDRVKLVNGEYHIVYIVTGFGWDAVKEDWIYELGCLCGQFTESDLEPANKLKQYDPVMVKCKENKYWTLRLYFNNDMCYADGNTGGLCKEPTKWDYVVPLSDFDFNNINSNILKSVVRTK